MPTQTQPWLRAELIAAPETTPGAQLMIPADGVEFHDGQLVFHRQGEIVYVAGQGQLRSITWFAKQPNPESARRKAQWPNHGTRWTDEEREDLLRRLRSGQPWKAISTAHGRSRTGCQQEAVKQGWLDPETLQLKPELLLTPSSPDAPAANPDGPPPPPSLAPSPDPDEPATAASTTSAAPPLTTNATTPPSPPLTTNTPTTPSPPRTTSTATSAPPLAESPPALAGALTTGSPQARHAAPATATATSAHAPAHPPSAPPPPDQFAHQVCDRPTPDAASTGKPNTDHPRIPPRIPRQRTDSNTFTDSNTDTRTDPAGNGSPGNPGSGSSPDPVSGPDSDPRPGSRFLSRAQSSLARATLGAYMSPPRSQSGASSGAT